MSATNNSVGEIRIPRVKRTCFREQESQAGPARRVPRPTSAWAGVLLGGLRPLKFRDKPDGVQLEVTNEIGYFTASAE
jgi:hypothetical protein